jgi:hypothetical protein
MLLFLWSTNQTAHEQPAEHPAQSPAPRPAHCHCAGLREILFANQPLGPSPAVRPPAANDSLWSDSGGTFDGHLTSLVLAGARGDSSTPRRRVSR